LLQPDGQQCTSVVKTKCSGLGGHTTSSWRRGQKVVDNCGLRSGTAIATFAGPNNSYNGGAFQHAAIFIQCSGADIIVDDQWAGKNPPGCTQRTIRASGTESNGAGNFYVINL